MDRTVCTTRSGAIPGAGRPTVVRPTVVAPFALIGPAVTGFLGLTLLALADAPMLERIAYFIVVLIPVAARTFYTIVKYKRQWDFPEPLSDERMQ